MRIIFHGENAASFSAGFAELVDPQADDPHPAGHPRRRATISAPMPRPTSSSASNSMRACPVPVALKLFHVPGAGYDAVDLAPAAADGCRLQLLRP